MDTSARSAAPAAAQVVGRETLSATLSEALRLRGVVFGVFGVGASFLDWFAPFALGVFGVRGVFGSGALACCFFFFIGVTGT